MISQRNLQEVPRFNSKPSHIIQAFLQHIRETASPETFPGITTTATSNLRDVEILTKFSVDRKKRPELDAIPCPICSPYSPKYLHGYLVYFKEEQCIRAIGQECGSRIDKEFTKKKQAFEKRARDELTAIYLETQLPKVPAMILEAVALHDKLTYQKTLWANFKKKCPAVALTLRSEMSSGVLAVGVKMDSGGRGLEAGQGTPKYSVKKIGSVVGQAFIKHDFKHDREVQNTLVLLRSVDRGDDVEAVYLSICDAAISDQIAIEKALLRAKIRISNATRLLEEFRVFYSEINIATINRWAQEPTSPMNFVLEFQPEANRLKVFSREYGTEFMEFRPDRM